MHTNCPHLDIRQSTITWIVLFWKFKNTERSQMVEWNHSEEITAVFPKSGIKNAVYITAFTWTRCEVPATSHHMKTLRSQSFSRATVRCQCSVINMLSILKANIRNFCFFNDKQIGGTHAQKHHRITEEKNIDKFCNFFEPQTSTKEIIHFLSNLLQKGK